MTTSEIVKEWLAYLEKKGKSVHTLAAYRRGLEHFVAWNKQTFNCEFDPAAIIPRDIRDWKSRQQTVEDASPATINQRLVALTSFFQWALIQGYAHSIPTLDIKGVGARKRVPKSLSENELRRLLRAVHASGNRRDTALIELLAGAGLRVGELLALRIGDLVLNDRSGYVVVRQGKNANYREVPLTAPVRQALMMYLGSLDSNKPGLPLWIGQRGEIKNRSSVLRILEKYSLAAQLPATVGPHQLRHTFATRYLKKNPGDIRGLAALLGHASLNTTMIYTEPALEDLAERMERVDTGS